MKLIGDYLAGGYALPSNREMQVTIKREERLYTGHFYDSARHRMQIDFNKYVWDLKREIRRGRRRAARQDRQVWEPVGAGDTR